MTRDEPLVAEVIESALLAVALSGGIDQRQIARRAGRADPRRDSMKRSSSAMAMFSAKPMPTKPPVATVSPSRIRRTASSALTIFPFLTPNSARLDD